MKKILLFLVFICLFEINTNAQNSSRLNYSKQNECLAAGTMITMADNSEKKIEQLTAGDVILTFDAETLSFSTKQVKNVRSAGLFNVFLLRLENGMEIYTPGFQPFYSLEGWAAMQPEVTTVKKPYYKSIGQVNKGSHLYFYGNNSRSALSGSAVRCIEATHQSRNIYYIDIDGNDGFVANKFIVGKM